VLLQIKTKILKSQCPSILFCLVEVLESQCPDAKGGGTHSRKSERYVHNNNNKKNYIKLRAREYFEQKVLSQLLKSQYPSIFTV
jgi:hypothetical protein